MDSEKLLGKPRNGAFTCLIIAALVGLIALTLRHFDTPPPAAAGDNPSAFSANRALPHIRQIARAPHPIGTAKNAEVREYLVHQLRALGYSPEVQSGLTIAKGSDRIGTPHNILARRPGRVKGPALMLVAHYDSVPESHGAADNGASVAAILEVLRALATEAPLRNDLIILLTDGEEAGLLGAHLFANQHPWRNDVGLVLNFEYRGNQGPVWMFETSGGNGGLIREWARAAPHPIGNSLVAEIYRHMPNQTDVSVFKAKNIPAMNFAAGEGYSSYHTELDRWDLLDVSTVQHQGETMLALTRHLGNRPLAGLKEADSVFFDLPVAGIVQYPSHPAIVFGLALALLSLAVIVLNVRARQARPLGVLAAVPGIALLWTLVAAAAHLLWLLVKLVHPQYELLSHGTTYNAGWYLVATVALCVAVFAPISKLSSRWLRPIELSSACVFVVAMLTLGAAILMPSASFLLQWPATPVALALLYLASDHGRSQPRHVQMLLQLCAAIPAIILLTPAIYFIYFALTPALIVVPALLIALLLGLLNPLLSMLLPARVLPALAALVLAACLLAGAHTGGTTAAQPAMTHIAYLQDDISNQGQWISQDPQLNAWTQRFFGASPQKRARQDLYGPQARAIWTMPTENLVSGKPSLRIVSDELKNNQRYLSLEINSPRGAPVLSMFVDGVRVKGASINGSDYRAPRPRRWRFGAYGLATQPIEVNLVVPAGEHFQVRLSDVSFGLPPHRFGPRPTGLIAQPSSGSETTSLVTVFKFEK